MMPKARPVTNTEDLYHRAGASDFAGANWWRLGEQLSLHPQAAYEQYRGAAGGLRPSAEQRPHLAVVCTAGLLSEHDQDADHGIDPDELGRLREAPHLPRPVSTRRRPDQSISDSPLTRGW